MSRRRKWVTGTVLAAGVALVIGGAAGGQAPMVVDDPILDA